MEVHYGVPEGIDLPDMDKARRNHLAVGARMADLIDTHVGQFVACFGDDQQFAFGDDPWELIRANPRGGASHGARPARAPAGSDLDPVSRIPGYLAHLSPFPVRRPLALFVAGGDCGACHGREVLACSTVEVGSTA